MDTRENCPHCGSAELFTVLCEPPTPHYGRTHCRKCQRFIRWEAAPMTDERALAYRFEFGKYRGKTVAEVLDLPDGPGYFRWFATRDMKPTMGRLVEHVLGMIREREATAIHDEGAR